MVSWGFESSIFRQPREACVATVQAISLDDKG